MRIEIKDGHCIVTRTEANEKFRQSGRSNNGFPGESAFWYNVQKAVRAKGIPLQRRRLTGRNKVDYLIAKDRQSPVQISIYDRESIDGLCSTATRFNKTGVRRLQIQYNVYNCQPNCHQLVQSLEKAYRLKWDLTFARWALMYEAFRRFEKYCQNPIWTIESLTHPGHWLGLGTDSEYDTAVKAGLMVRAINSPKIFDRRGNRHWWRVTQKGATILLAWHEAGYSTNNLMDNRPSRQGEVTPSIKVVGRKLSEFDGCLKVIENVA